MNVSMENTDYRHAFLLFMLQKEAVHWLLWFVCAVWVDVADQNFTRARGFIKEFFCHTTPLHILDIVLVDI